MKQSIDKITILEGSLYYLYNGHGDVIGINDESGNIIADYTYTIFGEAETENELIENPYRYSGEYLDFESGLYNLRARYYDPEIARFISEDTYRGQMTNPLSLNYYTYCSNNPVSYVDPSGHAIALPVIYVTYKVVGVVATVAVFLISLDNFNNGLNIDDMPSYDSFEFTISDNFSNYDFEGIPGFSNASDINEWLHSLPLSNFKTEQLPPFSLENFGVTFYFEGGVNSEWTRMTSKQSAETAKELGFEKTNYRAKNGEQIYYNKKTKTYISQDIGSGNGPHNGGVWKQAKTPEGLNSKDNRMGTYDAKLNRIRD